MKTLIDLVNICSLALVRFKPRVLSLLKAKSLSAFKGAGMLVLKRSFVLSFILSFIDSLDCLHLFSVYL